VPEIHGDDGLGGATKHYWDRRRDETLSEFRRQDGIQFIVDSARKYGRDLTIVSTGPLTNLALAIRKDPEAMRNVGKIDIMAGALEPRQATIGKSNDKIGNITPFAEFNVHCDPEACAVVLNFNVPLTLFPLDVTEKVHLLETTLTPKLDIAPEKLQLIKSIAADYMTFHSENYGFHGSFVHDALPVAALIDPTIFELQKREVVVDCSPGPTYGQTRAPLKGEKGADIEVAVGVNESRFLELFWQAMRRSIPFCKPPAEAK
jgi:inosine-uridine nucleoside N-ribohydrolase